jgi:hypothetical protein
MEGQRQLVAIQSASPGLHCPLETRPSRRLPDSAPVTSMALWAAKINPLRLLWIIAPRMPAEVRTRSVVSQS